MNIDEQQKNIISTIDEQEKNITSPNLEIDEESKMEFSWSKEVELHSQILSDENQNLKASTPEGNSLIPRMKTPTDPLATMYSSSPSQPANFQNKDEDELTFSANNLYIKSLEENLQADKEQDVLMPTTKHFSDAKEEMLIESVTELSNNTSKKNAVEKNNCEIEAFDKAEDYILSKKCLEEAPFTT
ncbi:423_t:CDS:2, partial [Cetraspora pellucida]